ncbi:tail protein X [Providencia sp. PROV060]|uniref:tail protein X n=1 Tax=Providencia sp. PROV060 TaxID=2949788 RepID=UPI00234A00A3|nr:tail protein X [Providencia sp. PROV060]EJD6045555.1 tail protein X [Providencia rettgeri]EJD6049624.1 tail protein X [Providencia rettgeri]ELR5103426.1 tail protein X [Providencia rettgeri]MDI7244462.1 tail protein X [Providencia rettgeri]
MKIRTMKGDTIDEICWRFYGRTTGMTEAVLLANPNLAEQSPIMPAGILIELPEVTEEPVQPLIQLWD